MSVSPAVLLLSLAIGGPLLLLALAVLYHASLIARQDDDWIDSPLEDDAPVMSGSPTLTGLPGTAAGASLDMLDQHVTRLVTGSTDAMIARLEQMANDVREQLQVQHATLESLMSASTRPIAQAPLPRAAGEPLTAMPMPPAIESRASQLSRLMAEGMSDRAIARQLRIGLEEVKIARSRGVTA